MGLKSFLQFLWYKSQYYQSENKDERGNLLISSVNIFAKLESARNFS